LLLTELLRLLLELLEPRNDGAPAALALDGFLLGPAADRSVPLVLESPEAADLPAALFLEFWPVLFCPVPVLFWPELFLDLPP